MKVKMDNHTVSDFLLHPGYRQGRHGLLQLVIFLITINVFWYDPLDGTSFLQRFGGWMVYWGTIEMIVYTNIYLLVPRFLLKNRLLLYLITVLGVITLCLALVVIGQGFLYTVVVPSQQEMGTLGMWLNAFSGVFTFGFVAAGTSAILLFRHWIRYNQRIDELQSMTLQSELQYLRNQINPHFLFNMLNNANVLIRKNPAEASQVLFKLEDLLRYQINDSSLEHISLASDIRFLNDYLNLEKIRRDKFTYILAKEGEIDSVQLPPLLFIPFVENAVKHSFDSENPSFIHLSFVIRDERLEFRCENSKPPIAMGNSGVGGIGLTNIRRRLELLYPGGHRLEMNDLERIFTVNLHLDL